MTYKKEFLNKIGLKTDSPINRYYVVRTFINKFFNQHTSYIYVSKDWVLADNIKKTLNIPSKYVYFTIRHIYNYVDAQKVDNEEECLVHEIIDYYTNDSLNIDTMVKQAIAV